MTTPFQPGYGGVGTLAIPAGTLVPTGFSPAAALQLVAQTPVAGFALQNATPTIISWTAPNDGQQHWVAVYGALLVTVLEVGGQVNMTYTLPNGTVSAGHTLFAAAQAATDYLPSNIGNVGVMPIAPGTTISVVQATALTGGAARVFAGIWAA